MMDDEDLWSDEINAFVDRAFETVSLSPSFYGEVAAYRYAIKLAIDEGRQTQTDALKIAREALRRAENAISNNSLHLCKSILNAALAKAGAALDKENDPKTIPAG